MTGVTSADAKPPRIDRRAMGVDRNHEPPEETRPSRECVPRSPEQNRTAHSLIRDARHEEGKHFAMAFEFFPRQLARMASQ